MERKSRNSNSAPVVKATGGFRMQQEALSLAQRGDGGKDIANVDPTLHEPTVFSGRQGFWCVTLSGPELP